ncbi:MAG TPA: hypothetical protein VK808_07345 [Bacteroidia bacterium]|nr:hypothetical protein [Bacteroidia bacterium]
MNTSKNISAAHLATRKLALIGWVVGIDDEKTIKEIEAILKKSKKRKLAKVKTRN